MSSCGYYSCHKGKPTCKHPENGKLYTVSGDLVLRCTACRRTCGGIYPSQLPKAKQDNWISDIIDKNGNVIVKGDK